MLNGSVPVAGATGATLVIAEADSSPGTYTCVASNLQGSTTSSPAVVTITGTSDKGRLANLSARAKAGVAGDAIFAGFVVGGQGTAGSQSVLVRASGPAIAVPPFNVPGTLPDPQLQLFSSNVAEIYTNEGWAGLAAISNAAAAVGAFPWTNTASHDAAMLLSLPAGPYTAQVAGQSGDTGDALVEVYDATAAGSYLASNPHLINLSARVDVGTGSDALIAGFVITGSSAVTVLIRASGPAIAGPPFNVPDTLPDPQLVVQNQSTAAVLATNSGWGGNPEIAGCAAAVGAFPWTDPSSHDSAILITLPPGAYTAMVAGSEGGTGVAIVEIYEVQ